MSRKIIKRFIWICAISLFVYLAGSYLYIYLNPGQGDFESRRGTNFLNEKEFEKAIVSFDTALNKYPTHYGAIMGKGIAYLQLSQYENAEIQFHHLIDLLSNLETNTEETKARLAVAYNNLAITYDRSQKYKLALDNYLNALNIDKDIVDGPGFVDKLLYGFEHTSTTIDRARYLVKQFKLKKEDRVFRVSKFDSLQRMYQP